MSDRNADLPSRREENESAGTPHRQGALTGRDAALVYVVDDDRDVRQALARLLRSAGLTVEAFGSAEAFLSQRLEDRPSCLVLDVRLPGPSGLDLQATLEQQQLGIPIVFVTGHGDVPMSVRAMKAGAVDFLEKPFDDDELLQAVERALELSREHGAERAARAMLQGRFAALTARERQVLGLVVQGLLNKQIADRLGAAEKTIKVHRGRVMEKMQANSVADLVRMTQTLGLHGPPSGT